MPESNEAVDLMSKSNQKETNHVSFALLIT